MKGTRNKSKGKNNGLTTADIKAIFSKLSGTLWVTEGGKEFMTDDQLFQFIMKDLGVAADDIVFGHIATNIMGIKKIQKTFFQNFEALFQTTKAQSVKNLTEIIKSKALHKELENQKTFKSMYQALFDLYSGTYITLDLEVAQSLWEVYLKNKLTYYKQFIEFISKNPEGQKIHRDLWNMVLQFSNEVKNIDKDYKSEDGWPVFIDKFVEHIKSNGK